jgi:hypothetical protein
VFITFSDIIDWEGGGTRVEKRHFKASKSGGVVRGVKEVTEEDRTATGHT